MDNLIYANSNIINDVLRLIEEEDVGFELGPRKDPIHIMNQSMMSTYISIFWSDLWCVWVGVQRIKNGYIFAFDNNQDGGLMCARKLNYICKCDGTISLLNSNISLIKLIQREWISTQYKQVYYHKLSGFYSSIFQGVQASSRNHNDHYIALRLNARCNKMKRHIPNPYIPCEFYQTEYICVYRISTFTGKNKWIGEIKDIDNNIFSKEKQTNKILCQSSKSSRHCAIKLNQECLKLDWPLPNPEIGIENPYLIPTIFKGIFMDIFNNSFIGLIPCHDVEIIDHTGVRNCVDKLNKICLIKGLSFLYLNISKDEGNKYNVNIMTFNNLLLEKKRKQILISFGATNSFGIKGPFLKNSYKSYIKNKSYFNNILYNNLESPKKRLILDNKRILYDTERKRSRWKGVYWETRDQKWRARIYYGGKRLSAGSYNEEKEAALAVNRLCRQLRMPLKNSDLEGMRLNKD